jgi:hypothetical protein
VVKAALELALEQAAQHRTAQQQVLAVARAAQTAAVEVVVAAAPLEQAAQVAARRVPAQ